MSTQSWELKDGSASIGVLSLIVIDQPWFRCEFTPREGWERVGHLFEEQALAVDSGDEERMMEAISAVRELPLELHPVQGEEMITPVMIQIRGDKANFRY
ncbi:hypothetical protein [Streptomyces sp. NPDC057199]|uniref:hypothetical protein n=1 Tax=Streptomyces sp. NPDC057199 TaxID=3346047 RepID=UPI003629C844